MTASADRFGPGVSAEAEQAHPGLLVPIAATKPSGTCDRIKLTMSEIRRLLATLVLTRHYFITDVLHWLDWRRRHQAIARNCRCQRRSEP